MHLRIVTKHAHGFVRESSTALLICLIIFILFRYHLCVSLVDSKANVRSSVVCLLPDLILAIICHLRHDIFGSRIGLLPFIIERVSIQPVHQVKLIIP